MKINVAKGLRSDTLDIVRDDGSTLTTTFPKKGPFPHDVVHWVVESQLNYEQGFCGSVADGIHPEELGALVKDNGHASSVRAEPPKRSIVELVQAERLVECFEAELWGTPSNASVFNSVFAAACDQSHVASRELSNDELVRVRTLLGQLQQCWDTLGPDERLSLSWGEGGAHALIV